MSLPMPPIDDGAGALQDGEAPGGILGTTEEAQQFDSPVTRKHRIKDTPRNLIVLAFGELCGTFMFLLLSFIGAQTAINNNINDAGEPGPFLYPFTLLYIASSFGCALAVNVWIFYRVSGGMFNPAVTVGLMLVGAVTPIKAAIIIPTQLIAGIAAAAVVDALVPGPLTVANSLGNGTSIPQGLFMEMFLTAQLVLTVYFLAVEKHKSTYLAPVAIGISVFIAHIAGTNYTGTSINPARSFGPAVITRFVGYHWIYWLGPLMGSFLSYGVYATLKWLEYASANPGQDHDDKEKAMSLASSQRSRTGTASTAGSRPIGATMGAHKSTPSAVSDATLSQGNSKEGGTKQA